MIWHVPPALAGQMAEVAFAADCRGNVYRRTEDRSDRSVAYEVADVADCGCDAECDCWDPANREPSGYDWAPCEAPRDDD